MEESIRVVCRLRPANSREAGLNLRKSVTVSSCSEVIVDCKPESKNFTFDYVAGEETQQDEIFQQVGVPITEACLQGFNGTILCYGPTGTGKSHTIFGGSKDNTVDGPAADDPQRGLVPRVLDYIFQYYNKAKESGETADTKLTFTSKCSFYEIYQEKVFDLLDNSNSTSASLQVREDSKRGVFIDGIIEEAVTTSEEAGRVLAMGYRNRHVGQTDMNRESSRSHAIFVLTLIITQDQENGTRKSRTSRFSLVDLAGSERQKDTLATGERLKEAGIINKSLSTLGNVINALSEKSSPKSRHINYRDSKLTFLLRDSLGGNTKVIIMNFNFLTRYTNSSIF
jgi:kinesin family protein 15